MNADKPLNPLQLDGKLWLGVIAVVAAAGMLLPEFGAKPGAFPTTPDYRVPYDLSKDYWLYNQHLKRAAQDKATVFVVGDSVVWGEYVRKEGVFSHFLNERLGDTAGPRFVNAGINGLFPLALDGLVAQYGRPMRGRKVILHCNVLWLSSREADMSADKEQAFNHQPLVPQRPGAVPCYRADIDTRLGHLADHALPTFGFANHLQIAHFDSLSIPEWTLATDGNWPPSYPNTYANPFERLIQPVKGELSTDPERGPESDRHRPWYDRGMTAQSFDWMPLEESLQWAAFQRVVQRLRAWNCNLLVVLGPFNTHMIAEENRKKYDRISTGVQQWFYENGIGYLVSEPLESKLYGDASHPLTEGYEVMATGLWEKEVFDKWAGVVPR
jgi:hypothetical protein